MDDILKDSLSDFDAVWRRVTGQSAGEGGAGGDMPSSCAGPAGPEKAPPPEDTLLALLRGEICAGACAGALARYFPADGRAVLQRMAAGSRRRLRRLRAERFIATGADGGDHVDCGGPSGKLASLRDIYLRFAALAEGYTAAAEKAADPDLRDAFAAFAGEARCSAREARALLIDSF